MKTEPSEERVSFNADRSSITVTDVDGDELVFSRHRSVHVEVTARAKESGNEIDVYLSEEHVRALLEWYRDTI